MRVDMIVSRAVVIPVEKRARRGNAVDDAGPIEARFPSIVARVVEKRAVLFVELEIQTRRLRIEGVAAWLPANEIVPALGVARLIRQWIERQVVARDRADSILRNDVVKKCRALNSIAHALCRERIKNLNAKRQQRREISVAFGQCRDRELRRFRKPLRS